MFFVNKFSNGDNLQTLQTIAFNAHLRGLGHYQPFLIVCPLSVLHNWIEEFQRFAPSVRFYAYFPSIIIEPFL
jgi:SNF2 family DNA or RNA helicase